MATTTNFGWETPDDTDLVKDGAAAIRTLGSSIDTTMATMVPKTVVDAKGDLIAATAADTVSRLAVGANDTVLTADSTTATGLKWASIASGGETLISSTSLSGASVSLTSIPSTYNDLKLVIEGMTNAAAADWSIRFNNDTTANLHQLAGRVSLTTGGGTVLDQNLSGTSLSWEGGTDPSNFRKSAAAGTLTLFIPNYTFAGRRSGNGSASYETSSGYSYTGSFGWRYWGSAAISRIDVTATSNFNGGTVKLYGVK